MYFSSNNRQRLIRSGTCKHMEAVKLWVRKKRKKVQVAEPDYSSVYIDYKGPRRVKIRIR